MEDNTPTIGANPFERKHYPQNSSVSTLHERFPSKMTFGKSVLSDENAEGMSDVAEKGKTLGVYPFSSDESQDEENEKADFFEID